MRPIARPGEVYSHSQAVQARVLLAPALALPGLAALAYLYALALVHMEPRGAANFLFCAAFALAAGHAVALGLKAGHVRNRLIAGLFGLAAVLFAVYACWVSFEYALLSRSVLGADFWAMARDPYGVFRLAGMISETGWYTLADWTPAGAVLWVFWGAEALAVAAGILWFGIRPNSRAVYCEHCRNWAVEHPSVVDFFAPAASDVMARIRHLEPEGIAGLRPAAPQDTVFFRAVFRTCPGCRRTTALDLYRVVRGTRPNGTVEEKRTRLLERFLVRRVNMERLAARVWDVANPVRPALQPKQA